MEVSAKSACESRLYAARADGNVVPPCAEFARVVRAEGAALECGIVKEVVMPVHAWGVDDLLGGDGGACPGGGPVRRAQRVRPPFKRAAGGEKFGPKRRFP
jgi:hypothetical protein